MTNHVLKNQNQNYPRQCMSAIPALRRLTRDCSRPAWAISETLPQKAKTGWRDDLVFKGTCCSGGGPGLSSHTHLSSGGSDALSWPPEDCMHAMYRRQQNT